MKANSQLFKYNVWKLNMIACLLFLSFQLNAQTIVYPGNGSDIELFAAKEVRRYIYLRTDQILPVEPVTSIPATGNIILIANDDNPMVNNLRSGINQTTTPGGIIIKSVNDNGRTVLVITGSNSESTLIAAYRFAEHLGVGFDFSGDAIPDVKIPLTLTGFDEAGVRRFETTGYLPFHDFLPGPDIWNTDDYMVIINQLAKMGMNFIGLHNYPTYGIQDEVAQDTRQGSEPNVWIGLPEDVNPDGTVNWSFPAYYRHSHSPHRIWGTTVLNTGDYWGGAADIFPRDFWGSDIFGTTAMPTDVAGYAEVFNNTGRMFNKSFGFAKEIGVKTALGTELPLGIEAQGPEVSQAWVRGMPLELQARLSNPGDPNTVKEVYKGIFDRIRKTHHLDYFWLWSYEIWSYYGFNAAQVDAIKADMNLALQAANELNVPFKLGHAGWIGGSGDNPAEFDAVLPKDNPFYVLWDEALGMEALSADRVKWAATWTEEDWGLIQPQINVQRVYRDVKAALQKNCHGLIGKGWRNRAVAMNTHAMRYAFWAYGPTGAPVNTAFPTDESAWIDEVYLDWATRWFGTEVAQDITNILAPMDKGGEPRQPIICEWDTDLEGTNSAGSVIVGQVNNMSQFNFINSIEALEPNVVGKGNKERFNYLLKMYQSYKAKAEFGTLKEEGEDSRAQAAAKMHEIITLDIERMVDACDVGEIMHNNVMNWHQMIQNVLGPGQDPSQTYTGESFIKVMPVRTQVAVNEALKLNIVAMGVDAPTLKYRELGGSTWTTITPSPAGRKVYTTTIPIQIQDFEYYIESGNTVFPVTANSSSPIYQTVVVMDNPDQISGIDDDNDGIPNDLDQCYGTPTGEAVDANGCMLLASNNFNIETISETCPNNNNGQIIIAAQTSYSYKATINGTDYNFTTNLTVDNLSPGSYEICIVVTGQTSPYCFNLEIKEGTTVSGKSSSTKNKTTVEIFEGTAPYEVLINGNMVLRTLSSTFDISAKHGDLIEVKTDKSCEGVFSKTIQLFDVITLYPNPTDGFFELIIPLNLEEVGIELYNNISQLISKRIYPISNGKVLLDLSNRSAGMYYLKVLSGTPVMLKIIRK